jgi:hypothetical protein
MLSNTDNSKPPSYPVGHPSHIHLNIGSCRMFLNGWMEQLDGFLHFGKWDRFAGPNGILHKHFQCVMFSFMAEIGVHIFAFLYDTPLCEDLVQNRYPLFPYYHTVVTSYVQMYHSMKLLN